MQGVKKCDLLCPIIFNILADVIIRHWEIVVYGGDSDIELFVRVVQNLNALFYTDDVILAYPCTASMQEALEVLVDLFDRLELSTNVEKTVIMVCQLCRTVGRQSE